MDTLALTSYRLLATLISPLLPIYLSLRRLRGKEDPARLDERLGRPSRSRPEGTVIWLHGASVGETVSSLTLATALLKIRPGDTILITSGTVTSAAMVEKRVRAAGMETRIIHQYVPLDVPFWVRRFVQHWRPDLAIIMETEIWPSLITETHAAGIPVVLASAQLSAKSFRLWSGRGRGLARAIFPRIRSVFTVDQDHARKFQSLPHPPRDVRAAGSMKNAAEALAPIPDLQEALNKSADGRQIILLASSHDGEEELFLEAMESLGGLDQFLFIIAPRHVERAGAIHALIAARGETAGRRSEPSWPRPQQRYWIADRMGEMGGLIRVADVIVLGGAFAPLGGHNPMEAAALGKGVISGRHVFKNTEAFNLLKQRNGVIFADNAADLARQVIQLTSSESLQNHLNQGAANTYRMVASKADDLARQLHHLIEEGA